MFQVFWFYIACWYFNSFQKGVRFFFPAQKLVFDTISGDLGRQFWLMPCVPGKP